MREQLPNSLRTIVKGFVLILSVIFFSEERGISRPVPSSRLNSSSSVKLVRVQDLSFGGAIGGLSAGTIIVNPNGSVLHTGGLMRKASAGISQAHPAQLNFTIFNASHCHDVDHVTSDDDEAVRHENDDAMTNDDRADFTRHGTNVTISLPQSATLQLPFPATGQMIADHFTILRTNGTFLIGATLHIGAMQPLGTYSGALDITVICE